MNAGRRWITSARCASITPTNCNLGLGHFTVIMPNCDCVWLKSCWLCHCGPELCSFPMLFDLGQFWLHINTYLTDFLLLYSTLFMIIQHIICLEMVAHRTLNHIECWLSDSSQSKKVIWWNNYSLRYYLSVWWKRPQQVKHHEKKRRKISILW